MILDTEIREFIFITSNGLACSCRSCEYNCYQTCTEKDMIIPNSYQCPKYNCGYVQPEHRFTSEEMFDMLGAINESC